MGKKLADKATRDGVAERCPDPAVHKSLEVDLDRGSELQRALCARR